MVFAVAHFGNWIVLHTAITLNQVKVGPDLPVDFLPGNAIGLSDEGYELLEVPVSVNDVLGAALAVMVDEASAFTAAQHLSLLLSEKLIAVGTLVKVVLVFLKQKL